MLARPPQHTGGLRQLARLLEAPGESQRQGGSLVALEPLLFEPHAQELDQLGLLVAALEQSDEVLDSEAAL